MSVHGQNQPRHTAGDGSLSFHPARYAKTYEQWHDNIRDWCISRQLWWGHRIPVWSKRVHLTEHNCARRAWQAGIGSPTNCSAKNAPVAWWTDGPKGHRCCVRSATAGRHDLRSVTCWIRPTEGDCDPTHDIYICLRDRRGGVTTSSAHGMVRDPDVLDTWFSSALWPMSTMGWPDAELAAKETGIADFPSLLPAFNPTSTLCTAREIITLWVSRMVMFNRYFLSPSPPRGGPGWGGPNSEGTPAPRETRDNRQPHPGPPPGGRGSLCPSATSSSTASCRTERAAR